MTIADEDLRIEMLPDAQDRAAQLFAEVEQRGLIRAGAGEKTAVRRHPRPRRRPLRRHQALA